MNEKIIWKRVLVLLSILPVQIIAAVFSGCSFDGGSELDVSDMAEVTSLALDYQSLVIEGGKAAMEVDAVDEDYSKSQAFSKSVYGVDSPDYILDDGTQVFIVREYKDNDTPANEEDDYVVITRSYYIDSAGGDDYELEFTEVINLSVKTEASWSVWDNSELLNDDGSFSQDGLVTRYIGDVDGASVEAEMVVTWVKAGEAVELQSIVKESVHLLNMTTVITTITFDDDDNPIKEQLRIKVVDGDEIVVNSFIYTQYEEDGFTKTKILREDGAYAVRWRDTAYVDPEGDEKPAWIQEYYNVSGVLRSRKIETGYRLAREVLFYVYDETGTELIDTRSMSVSFSENADGSIAVEKILDNGDFVTLNIIESDDGYTITRNGFTYFVTVDLTDGIVKIYDETGTLLGTVTIEDDGSYTVEKAGNVSERIEI